MAVRLEMLPPKTVDLGEQIFAFKNASRLHGSGASGQGPPTKTTRPFVVVGLFFALAVSAPALNRAKVPPSPRMSTRSNKVLELAGTLPRPDHGSLQKGFQHPQRIPRKRQTLRGVEIADEMADQDWNNHADVLSSDGTEIGTTFSR